MILITEASSGIGAAYAIHLAKEGALLALVGRKFTKVVDKIRESGVETGSLIILADISVDAERIVSEMFEKYERIDVFINNAAYGLQRHWNR